MLPIDNYGVEIQRNVATRKASDDQFSIGPLRNHNASVVAGHVSIDNSMKHAAVAATSIDPFRRADVDRCTGRDNLDSSKSSLLCTRRADEKCRAKENSSKYRNDRFVR